MALDGSNDAADMADTKPLGNPRSDPLDRYRKALPEEMLDHPRYELLELLGAGGMGIVYKAQHRYMDRPVALKLIHQALLKRRGIVKQFHQEVRAAARLTHPNIVHAYDADAWRGTHFLVMEYIDGADLDRVLARDERLSVPMAADYIRQAALGLEHAWRRGMVHLDIKPHNLMVDQSGQIKILDFGLARLVSQSAARGLTMQARRAPQLKSEPGARFGTLHYMAPEAIVAPDQADIRADIYSLGCTLHRLLTGEVLCPGDTVEDRLDCQPADCSQLLSLADVPPALVRTVQRMVASEPADRFQTPLEVAEALRPFAETSIQKILVVDDDATTRWAMQRVLSEQGYQTVAAPNGQEALSTLAAVPGIDLILLDLEMPVMDGWSLLRVLKQDAALDAIPVVIVSSNAPLDAMPGDVGAAAALRKPVHVDRLMSVIGGRCASARSRF